MTENRRVRVRFAPSPTGPLHIGGVRTALYNYLVAKKNNGDFILRIEDTDQTRYVKGAEEYIIESLKWLGIEPNEGVGFGDGVHAPYRQSERKSIYKQYAMQLVESGYAYYAFDTADDIEAMRERLRASNVDAKYDAITRSTMKNSLTLPDELVQEKLTQGEPYVIRIKLPRKEEVKFFDEIRGWVSFNTSQMDDKVLFKSDGMPTYHLANVVDDYLMQISHVIRGEEWLPSAPLHVLLYKYLGWEQAMPVFAHLPLLLKPEGNGKLSKRDGDRLGFPVFPLQWADPDTKEISSGYRETGYLPAAVINLLALLGWNPGGNKELLSLDELINLFSLNRVSKAGAKFDVNKARWFNQQYIRMLNDEEIAAFLHNALNQNQITGFNNDYILKVSSLVKEKISFTNEVWEYAKYMFVEPKTYDDNVIKKRWNENSSSIFNQLCNKFENLENFEKVEIEKTYHSILENNGLLPKDFLQLFRVCITGVAGGPPLFDIIELIGKTNTINRIKNFLNLQSK